jgi:hypothetical protein
MAAMEAVTIVARPKRQENNAYKFDKRRRRQQQQVRC